MKKEEKKEEEKEEEEEEGNEEEEEEEEEEEDEKEQQQEQLQQQQQQQQQQQRQTNRFKLPIAFYTIAILVTSNTISSQASPVKDVLLPVCLFSISVHCLLVFLSVYR